MSDQQDQMDNLTKADLEEAGMWSGLDDRGTAVSVREVTIEQDLPY